MKTLILSCNTGQGHNSCATAIKEVYDREGECCVIEDALRFISPHASDFISGWHVRIYRHLPTVFKFSYNIIEKFPNVTFGDKSASYKFFALGAKKLVEFIRDGGYDAVICTHVFAAMMLTAGAKKYYLDVKTALVHTDYTLTPGTKASNLDIYFLPVSELAEQFRCKNIPENKMITSGIPIRQMFYNKIDIDEAKKKLGIDKDARHVVLMCGSMGCGPIPKMIEELKKEVKVKWHLTVICGTNKKLFDKVEKLFGDDESISVLGFVKDIPLLMDSADLYITKPGGLSVTESNAKNLPMAFINVVAACEDDNRLWFLKNGCAIEGEDPKELAKHCAKVLGNDELLAELKRNITEMENLNTSEIIFETMKGLVEEDDFASV